ncbi:MAG: hypothetical protein H0Z34_05780 [Brevibacillus sp.]|nr:hypothetical protein [Brevibacillus sp.]
MTFRQFACNNVIRNKRTYAAYFFSSVFSVMIFFMYAMFIYHPDIESGKVHWSAAEGMRVAEYIIYVFAFFFLFYSVSAFLKKREEIANQLNEVIGSSDAYQFTARSLPYHQSKQMANTVLFVGLFLGILFFVASGSFLYFRLYTDLETDKRQYRAITKIGLTEKELTRIVSTQIALLFFVPIAVAIVHSSIAFVSLHSMLTLLHVSSIVKPTATVLTSFLLVQIVYFLLIRARYLYHLKQAVR